jgi:hypothetical protein
MDEEYTKEQYTALKYSNEQFDKSIQLIASGALGISFAFIEKIVKLEYAICKSLLINAWVIFAIVIFISLITHFVSILANRWAIENLYEVDADINTKLDYFKKARRYWNYPIRALNVMMIIGLFIGMLFLITFIKQNI